MGGFSINFGPESSCRGQSRHRRFGSQKRRKASFSALLETLELRSLLSGSLGAVMGSVTLPSSTAQVGQVASSAASPWTFAVVGDSHVGSSKTPGEIRSQEVATSIDESGVSMVLFLGDQADTGTSSQFQQWKATWNNAWKEASAIYPTRTAPTVFVVVGNHDLWLGGPNREKNFSNAFPQMQYTPGTSAPQLIPVTRLTLDTKDLSYSFTFNQIRFIGLDEYVKGNVSKPAVSNEDLHALESSQLPVGVKSTVVFGHVPDQSPSTTKPKSQGDYFTGAHPYYLPNGLPFFKVDINAQKGLYYFAGHDHGYFPPRNGATPIDVHANHHLEQVVSAAGGAANTLQYAIVTVSEGLVTGVQRVKLK